MMLRIPLLGLAIALLLLTSACGIRPASNPAGVEPSLTQSRPAAAPPAALLDRIRSTLSAETGISTAQITLKSAEAVTWNDSCLGLAHPAEVCLMALTPGYRIVLSTPTGEYEFHTDRQRSFRKK